MRKIIGVLLISLFCITLFSQTIDEGFEGGEIPADWTVINNDGDDYEWEAYQTTSSHSGDYCARVHYNSSGCDDWLITPQITVNPDDTFSFWAATNSASYLEDFNVKVSQTGTAVSDFTILIDEILQTPFDWTQYSYNLTDNPDINPGDQVYIAIQCVSVDAWYLFIDDIIVDAVPTSPILDIDFTSWDAGGVLLGNTADPGNLFEITNIGVGTLEFTSITDLSGTEFSTDFELTTQLGAGESYSFGMDYTPAVTQSDEVIFTIESNGGDPVEITLTGYGVEAKLYESFESDMIPADWTVVNNDGGTYEWETFSGEAAHEGTFGLQKHYEDTSDDWIITPQILVEDGDTFSFWAAAFDEDYPEDFNVKASSTGNSIADFTINLEEVLDTPIEWTSYSYDLTADPAINDGDNIYLAIQCVSADAYYLFLDDFYVGSDPVGVEPNNIIPADEIVLQNYPNPFNPSTTISFDLSNENSENINIAIYNLRGQIVKSFDFAQDDSKDVYSVTWNGTDINNHPTSSGVYFYSLKAGDKILKTNKMLLLK